MSGADIVVYKCINEECPKNSFRGKRRPQGEPVRCPECQAPLNIFCSNSDNERKAFRRSSYSSIRWDWIIGIGGLALALLLVVGFVLWMRQAKTQRFEFASTTHSKKETVPADAKGLQPKVKEESTAIPAKVKYQKRKDQNRKQKRQRSEAAPPKKTQQIGDGAQQVNKKGSGKPTPKRDTVVPKSPNKTNPVLILPFDRLAPAPILDKLKAVRLVAKASFANARNVNDVTIMWSWDPDITVRIEERRDNKTIQALRLLFKLLDRQRKQRLEWELNKAYRKMKAEMKRDLVSDPQRYKIFDQTMDEVVKSNGLSALFNTVHRIQRKKVYQEFNGIPFLLKEKATSYLRPLCFALSISNLVPLKRHKFDVKLGNFAWVKGKKCRRYHVKDPSGTALEFFFDVNTQLLAKISHRGRYAHRTERAADPQWGPQPFPGGTPIPGAASKSPEVPGREGGTPFPGGARFPGADQNADSQWDHYFSDYQQTNGIMQWRKHELYRDRNRFCSLKVIEVRTYETLPAELENKLEAVKYVAQQRANRQEKFAAKYLEYVNEALTSGHTAKAVERCKTLIDVYPGTRSALEAKKILKRLNK